ncbi:unnamed protein product [Ectocarpus sp. 12 AP-2014]
MMSVSLLEITSSPSGSECVSVSAEALSAVRKLPQKPLNLITIWGAARTGKSFFMNALTGVAGNDIFAVAGGSHPCTVGAFISTTTHSLSDFGGESGSPTAVSSSQLSGTNLGADVQPEIGFVDVEGQGDGHLTYEVKLATPLLLLSKVVFFNWLGQPNKTTMLDRLGMMREAAATIDRSQRRDRQIAQGEVSPAFAAKVNNLRQLLATDLLARPHSFGNEAIVGGELLSSLLTGVCKAVNGGLSNFFPLSLMQSIQQRRAETMLSESKKLFKQSVAKSVEGKPPLSKAATKNVIEVATSTAVGYFTAQSLAESVASTYREKLEEVIDEGSKACYAAQERQVSDAINQVNRLRSESLQQVDKNANKLMLSFPMEVDELMRRWQRLCAEGHGQLQRSVEKHLGGGILEDLQGELPTPHQFEDGVSDKLSNLIASNQSLLKSEQGNKILEEVLRESKEANEEAEKRVDAMQKGNERLLQELRERREADERAQQAAIDREASAHMWQAFGSIAMGALEAFGSRATGASGSSDEATESGSVRAATPATPTRSRPTRDVDVGPIRDQDHAERKAREYIAEHPDLEWTGHWTTTSEGRASVIGVRDKA